MTKISFPPRPTPLKLMKSKQKTMKIAYSGRLFLFLALCTLHAMQDSYFCIFFCDTFLNLLSLAYSEAM